MEWWIELPSIVIGGIFVLAIIGGVVGFIRDLFFNRKLSAPEKYLGVRFYLAEDERRNKVRIRAKLIIPGIIFVIVLSLTWWVVMQIYDALYLERSSRYLYVYTALYLSLLIAAYPFNFFVAKMELESQEVFLHTILACKRAVPAFCVGIVAFSLLRMWGLPEKFADPICFLPVGVYFFMRCKLTP